MQSVQIFLSYSRADAAFALKLGDDLRKAGIDIWIDQYDIPPAVPWDEEIQKGLDASKGLLVILSATSVASDNVLNEINYALETGKQVWPVLMESGIRKPFNINRLQHVDFTTDYESAFNSLLASLQKDKGPQSAGSTPLNKAKRNRYLPVFVILALVITGALFYALSGGVLLNRNNQPEKFQTKAADFSGAWVSDTVTNPFDNFDRYMIHFKFEMEDSLVTGDMVLNSPKNYRNYRLRREFTEGVVRGTNISFITSQNAFQGDEQFSFKDFYKGVIEGDIIRFTWKSNRPGGFPEQHFTAKKHTGNLTRSTSADSSRRQAP